MPSALAPAADSTRYRLTRRLRAADHRAAGQTWSTSRSSTAGLPIFGPPERRFVVRAIEFAIDSCLQMRAQAPSWLIMRSNDPNEGSASTSVSHSSASAGLQTSPRVGSRSGSASRSSRKLIRRLADVRPSISERALTTINANGWIERRGEGAEREFRLTQSGLEALRRSDDRPLRRLRCEKSRAGRAVRRMRRYRPSHRAPRQAA